VSGEALYEQYKEALKRGHVAALRGRVEEALIAYAEAARIAPERPTPHASAGNALLRHGRPDEALRHYEVALAIARADEAALLGRAQALAALGRHGEGADAFDVLAEIQAGSGRLAEAVDAARRGLELAEGRERRRTLERLIARLRASEPDEPGRLALERALQVLDGLAVRQPSASSADWGSEVPATALEAPPMPVSERPAVAPTAPGGEPAVAADTESPAREGDQPGAPGAPDDAGVAAAGVTALDAAQDGAASEPESAVGPRARARREIPAGATVAELAARAESELDAGTPEPAVNALLDLAAAYRRDGDVDAALDACYSALSFDPDSVALHLALAELYLDHGWDGLAAEKLDLLERLAQLDGDEAAVVEIAGLRADRL
jgi:tetratricopeptide (TPR) repeat protein